MIRNAAVFVRALILIIAVYAAAVYEWVHSGLVNPTEIVTG